jgi:predicted  nucleic acid-binding Zn-ribbon protein
MSKNFYEEGFPDDDPTDELPVLTDVVVEQDRAAVEPARASDEDAGQRQQPGPGQIPTLEDRDETVTELARDIADRDAKLATLESELANLEGRWRQTSAELAARTAALTATNTELEEHRAHRETQRDATEQLNNTLRDRDEKIVALMADLDTARASAAALEDNVRVLEERIAELEAEVTRTREAAPSKSDAESTTKLREEVAALAEHIESRNVVWRQQAAEVVEKTTRIRELELELAQRTAAERAATRLAELEASRASDYRERLVAATAGLGTIEPRPQTAPAPPDTATPQEAATTAEHDDSSPVSGGGRLSAELERAVALQQSAGDDLEGLRRLEELELAIRELEKDMDETVAAVHEAGSEAIPPQLICLTGDEPEIYTLDERDIVIGRGSHCGIRLMTHYVSREHARLVTGDDQCVLEDLGSRNGVFVNSIRIERQALYDDDLITIGDTQFRFRDAGHGEA